MLDKANRSSNGASYCMHGVLLLTGMSGSTAGPLHRLLLNRSLASTDQRCSERSNGMWAGPARQPPATSRPASRPGPPSPLQANRGRPGAAWWQR